MKHRYDKKIIVFLLAIFISLSTFSGCDRNSSSESYSSSNSLSNISNNVSDYLSTNSYTSEEEKFSSKNSNYDNSSETVNENSSESENINPNNTIRRIGYSYDYRDYVGDIETFVYGLIIQQLQTQYYTFASYIELEPGIYVSGLAYTDYEECYEDENNFYYYLSGFLPYYGEIDIPNELFESGLEIIPYEYSEENVKFIWTYKSSELWDHCVVYDKYLKYGINSQGEIDYTTTDYVRGQSDESLGTLYSYDEGRCVYDVDFGEFVPVTGETLSYNIDYSLIENELNQVLEKQNFNYITYDLSSNFNFAKDYLKTYLLSLNRETFLGYSVEELVSIASSLNENEVLTIDSNGIATFDLEESPNSKPSSLTKWLVGASCAVVTLAGVALTTISNVYPPLKPILGAIGGALSGFAIDLFMQVIFDNKKIDDINWARASISAVSGAISGAIGIWVGGKLTGATYFFVDTAVDGIIGGLEGLILASIDGKKGIELLNEFGTAFLCAALFSSALKGLGKALQSFSNSNIGKKFGNFLQNMGKKVKAGVSNVLEKIKNGIDSKFPRLDKVMDSSVGKTKWFSNKVLKPLFEKAKINSINKLSIKYEMFNNSGELINKKMLTEIFDGSSNGDIIGYFIKDGVKINIIKNNFVASIDFDTKLKVILENGISTTRKKTFQDACVEFLEYFKKNISDIPEDISNRMKTMFPDDPIEDILEQYSSNPTNAYKFYQEIIAKSQYVIHESIDGKTVSLVLRELHDKVGGYVGVSHYGGFALKNYIKTNIATVKFSDILSLLLKPVH